MSGIMQQLCDEARYDEKVEIARELLTQGLAEEQVAKATKLPIAAVQELAGEKSA